MVIEKRNLEEFVFISILAVVDTSCLNNAHTKSLYVCARGVHKLNEGIRSTENREGKNRERKKFSVVPLFLLPTGPFAVSLQLSA